MTTPVVVGDPAVAAIGVVMGALADAFDPASDFPPENGSTDVHFFAGEGPAEAAWNAHTDELGCDAPFLWVRVGRRFRTKNLPAVAIDNTGCQLPRAMDVEVGVVRCAVPDVDPTWDQYEAEAETSLDDSWRIELALCAAAGRLRAQGYLCAPGTINAGGPEGGVIGWKALLYVQFAN